MNACTVAVLCQEVNPVMLCKSRFVLSCHFQEGTATTGVEGDGDGEESPKEPPVYLDVRDWRRYIPPLRKQESRETLR